MLCRKCAVATWASLIVNFFLLAAKLWGFAVSASYSVLASAADSVVDIASQAVLALADWQVGKVDPQYPVGKTRLQTVAVIACAVIMSFATLTVIQESGKSLYSGLATGDQLNITDVQLKVIQHSPSTLQKCLSLTTWNALQACLLS